MRLWSHFSFLSLSENYKFALLKNKVAMSKKGYTYILTNINHTVLYTGITSNLPQRMEEHRTGRYKTSFSLQNTM